METPSLGCLHGEIEPKWHHVLSQAKTCSPGQGTLEQKIFWTAEHVYRDTPQKNTRTFITRKGSPRNYRIASKTRNRIFAARQKRTTDTGTDKSNQKISKRFLHGKKKLYDLGKTNCLSEFYILLFYPSVPARMTDDHPNISKKNFYKTIRPIEMCLYVDFFLKQEHYYLHNQPHRAGLVHPLPQHLQMYMDLMIG